MRQDRVGASGPDDCGQLLAVRATDAGEAAEPGEQRLAPPRTDPRNLIECRPQIALRARLAMEGDRKAVGFVANALDEQQRRAVGRERYRIDAVAGEQQLFFL